MGEQYSLSVPIGSIHRKGNGIQVTCPGCTDNRFDWFPPGDETRPDDEYEKHCENCNAKLTFVANHYCDEAISGKLSDIAITDFETNTNDYGVRYQKEIECPLCCRNVVFTLSKGPMKNTEGHELYSS
jgi:hypothetical protein